MNETPYVIKVMKQWDAICSYTTIEEVRKFDKYVLPKLSRFDTVAIDTETTDLDSNIASMRGYSFSFEEGVAYWVPIENDPSLWLLKRVIKDRVLPMANAGYDIPIIEKSSDIKINDTLVRDVLFAAFFNDVENYKMHAGLKEQANIHLHLPTFELQDIIKANLGVEKLASDQIKFDILEPWQKRVYGSQDADITLRLWHLKSFQESIQRMEGCWTVEHEVIRPVIEMYKNGISIDIKKCAKFDKILEKACDQCQKEAYEMALRECETIKDDYGNVVFKNADLRNLTIKYYKSKEPKILGLNLGSFPQKQILLFEELKIKKTRQVKSGYSTDAQELAQIKDEHPIIPLVIQYNKLASRRNNYTKEKALPSMINVVTGRVHPSQWQTGTKSQRFSCTNPNLQGVPKDLTEQDIVHIRELFVAEKGKELTVADYSQIELRIAASLSKEPVWQKAYRSGKNADVHRDTAMAIYGVAEPTDLQRSRAKTGNFSILTGITAHAFGKDNNMPIEEAQEFIDNWFGALPVLTTWIKEVHARTRILGYAQTHFGFIRPFPDIIDPRPDVVMQRVNTYLQYPWSHEYSDDALYTMAQNSLMRGFCNKALSHYIQGTAAGIIKRALVKVYRGIIKHKMPIKILLTVHDEIVFENPPKMRKEIMEFLQEHMEFKADDERLNTPNTSWVPLTIDVGHGHSWADAK